MALGLLGKKIGMTRIFDEGGAVMPVTVVQAGPCPILQVKTRATDGYAALQLGFDPKPPRRASRPELGRLKKSGAGPVRFVREVRLEEAAEYEPGKSLSVDIFKVGERVDVTGVSKGRGFAGPMKRHHSSRGPESHGSMYHRRPGSMGASADPSHVFKGKAAAGHMGAERVTVQNLRIVEIDAGRNVLVLRGSLPGPDDGYLIVAKSKKAARKAARKAAK